MQTTLLALDHSEFVLGGVVILVFDSVGNEGRIGGSAIVAAYFNLLDVIFHAKITFKSSVLNYMHLCAASIISSLQFSRQPEFLNAKPKDQ